MCKRVRGKKMAEVERYNLERKDRSRRPMKKQIFEMQGRQRREGNREKKPLGERIIWPLTSSSAATNGKGWVPTIPMTLEVSWREAVLIKLSPRLRRMIAGSNAQNNPLTPTINTTISSSFSALHIHIFLPPYLCASPHYSLYFSFNSLSFFFFVCLKSVWLSCYKWMNPCHPVLMDFKYQPLPVDLPATLMLDWISCLLVTRRFIDMDLLVLPSVLVLIF